MAKVLDSKTAHINPFPMHIQDHMSFKESKIEIKQKKSWTEQGHTRVPSQSFPFGPTGLQIHVYNGTLINLITL